MSKTILIIEDEFYNRMLLLDLFTAFGYSVLVAADGVEGLELALKAKPDLIVMDLGLPRLDGWSVARRLTSEPRDCVAPIIALTAWVRPEDNQLAKESGCDVYLRKPIRTGELIHIVRRILHG